MLQVKWFVCDRLNLKKINIKNYESYEKLNQIELLIPTQHSSRKEKEKYVQKPIEKIHKWRINHI